MSDNILNHVYTSSEAEQLWGLREGRIRSSCTRGPLKPYIDKGLVKQSGKVWLVTDQAMKEVYGNPKEV